MSFDLALWGHFGLVPRERFIKVGSGRVRVLETGQGPAVIFIAGSPNAGSIFAPLVAQLPGYRALVLDRPGTGSSDSMSFGTAREEVTEVLDAVCAAYGLSSVSLAGSSIGGWWALAYAIERPGRVNAMLQLGCPAGLPGERLPWGVRVMALPGMTALMLSMKPSPSGVKMVFKMIGHGRALADGRLGQPVLDWYLALIRDTPTQRNELTADARRMRFFSPALLELGLTEEELQRIDCPVALVWGTEDNFGGAAEAKRCQGLFPRASLQMVDGGGHLPWLDDPALAARQALTAFPAAKSTAPGFVQTLSA